MDSFADVIELWPSAVECAADIGQKPVTVRAWKVRGIPAEYWVDLVRAAQRRARAATDAGRLDEADKFSLVTYELLAALAAKCRAGGSVMGPPA